MLNALKAITKQPMATNGLNLSPTRANFQKMPKAPDFLLFRMAGAVEWMYVHVQMRRRITWRSDWKLNNADCC